MADGSSDDIYTVLRQYLAGMLRAMEYTDLSSGSGWHVSPAIVVKMWGVPLGNLLRECLNAHRDVHSKPNSMTEPTPGLRQESPYIRRGNSGAVLSSNSDVDVPMGIPPLVEDTDQMCICHFAFVNCGYHAPPEEVFW